MYDLAIRGGTAVLGDAVVRCDIGVSGGRIAAIAEHIDEARQVIRADGLLVMPGGVDTHCHIEEPLPEGGFQEESWESASRSAFAGGTTSVVCHTTQDKGGTLLERHRSNRERAAAGAMVDYGFHQIVADPSDAALAEIPALAADGIGSLKAFLTYDNVHLDDAAFLRVLQAAKRNGLMVHVHCENYDAINLAVSTLLANGCTAPKFHALSRPPVVEREATARAIALAELVGQPIHIFHVSCAEVAEEIARAQARGVAVKGETCPQYVTLTADDMDRPGFEGAKFMCSPPPRTAADHAGVWSMIRRGVLDMITSDHCAFSFEGTRGKAKNGRDAAFDVIPNGVPGLAARLPVVFSEGVSKGRIDLPTFVKLVAENPARIAGLYPRKGVIAVGSDADLVLWDAERPVTLTNALMQHAVDYTPYEGLEVVGWPAATIRRGEVVMQADVVLARPGTGQWLPRGPGAR
ncbi:dihydropyrimidinase [Roseomonas populi]|uniref:Dihydropyrimidinase n=1 Tax=Roseomonas populi TaxID=3121582 RepID=A0ABT1X1J2_9PROT|nr:dihydropyrimidinase [Roseomonas pecuniae]MCR0981968.1 dihydropyrimidinase [Roseomonas pecuniae]